MELCGYSFWNMQWKLADMYQKVLEICQTIHRGRMCIFHVKCKHKLQRHRPRDAQRTYVQIPSQLCIVMLRTYTMKSIDDFYVSPIITVYSLVYTCIKSHRRQTKKYSKRRTYVYIPLRYVPKPQGNRPGNPQRSNVDIPFENCNASLIFYPKRLRTYVRQSTEDLCAHSLNQNKSQRHRPRDAQRSYVYIL